MKSKEIKLFIRFLKDEDFNVKYKKFFFDEKIGFGCRKYYFKESYYRLGTIFSFLRFVNKHDVFNGFWWLTKNHDCYVEIRNLKTKWLIYYDRFIQLYGKKETLVNNSFFSILERE